MHCASESRRRNYVRPPPEGLHICGQLGFIAQAMGGPEVETVLEGGTVVGSMRFLPQSADLVVAAAQGGAIASRTAAPPDSLALL